MTRRAWQLLLWPALAAVLLATAWLLIDTTFMFYDDEGYLLQSLRGYLGGGRIYDDIFTQYGPWPYVYHELVTTVLQLPLTHMVGRGLTALHWVAAVVLCGALAGRLTGRTAAAVAAALTAFGLLWQMCSEPSHPGSLISLLVAAAVVLAARVPGAARPAGPAAALGALVALLFLTKINVGLLLLAGAGCAALRFTAWPERWQRPAGVAAALGLLAVPWALMAKKLDDPWALIFAVQFTLGAAGLLWVTPPAWTGRPLRPRLWLAPIAAFGLAGLAVCAVVCWHGTTVAALVQAVLVSPLRHPARFMFGFTWLPAVWPVAAAAWLLTARAGWELRRHGGVSAPVRHLLIAARLATLVVFGFNATTWLTILGVSRFIVFYLPLLPLFVVPLTARAATEPVRLLAGWLAAFLALPQVLHAFPVAGSQMGWGTFILVPFFVAGLHEAWQSLAPALPRGRQWLAPAGWAALLAINFCQLWLLGSTGWERYRTSRPLDLPGANDIRLDGPARLALRTLTLNATLHADLLFSRPGMFSYNLWSGVPTPTAQNATHWFWLLDEAAQRRIVDRLRATPRSAIITNRPLDEFLEKIKISMEGPLQDHIVTAYQPLFELNDFTFLVPRGSKAVPFGKIALLGKADAEPDGREPVLLRVNLVLDGRPTAVRLERSSHPWRVLHDYVRQQARIHLEPISSTGETRGPALTLPLAQPVRGLFRLTIFSDDNPRAQFPRDVVLVVADPEGRVLSEAVF